MDVQRRSKNIPEESKPVQHDPGATTAAVEQHLRALQGLHGDSPAKPIVRSLLTHAAGRLHVLCSAVLRQSYPRLMYAPLNLEVDDLLGSVVERLMKALEEARPKTVRQFFALANMHMRWELNDLARRLDKLTPDVALAESIAVAPESSGSELSHAARKILLAIENLPEGEREAFSLVRIQGMSHSEAAEILSISTKTVQRRLNRCLMSLTKSLSELQIGEEDE